MKLSAPKATVFLITLVVAIVTVVSFFLHIPFVSENKFWFMTGSYVLLALGMVL